MRLTGWSPSVKVILPLPCRIATRASGLRRRCSAGLTGLALDILRSPCSPDKLLLLTAISAAAKAVLSGRAWAMIWSAVCDLDL